MWLDGASDPRVELRLSGALLEIQQTIDVDGVMLSVEPPRRHGRLELSTPDGDWAIELLSVSERFEALREDVQASWRQGDAEVALKRFERAMAELDDAEAAMLACSVGKVVLAAGDHERVLAIAKQVSSSSVVSCVGKASLLAAYIQIDLRPDFNGAELSLRAAEAVQGIDLDTRIGAAYLRGVLEHRLGDIDESLVAFERAARLAWLTGDDKQRASALIMQATALARLGRFEEAEVLAGEVEQRSGQLHPTLAVNIRSNAGWIAVLQREDDPSMPDPSVALRSEIAEYVARNETRSLARQRLNLALALLQNADLEGAETELATIEPDELSPDLTVWLELTKARIDLLRRRFGAAEDHLDRARLLAELNQDRELEWRVMITSGELERARGRSASAIEEFRAASRVADELALSVAGDAGRSLFVTSHSRADIALTELLLDRGDAREAICTTIAARARHLRGLWSGLRAPLSGDAERRYRDLLSRHHQRKQEITASLDSAWELSTSELEVLRERLDAEGERADKLLAEATTLLEEGAPSWSCEGVLPERPGDAVMTMAPSFDGDRWTAMLARRSPERELVIETASVLAGDLRAAGVSILEEFSQSLHQVSNLRVIPTGPFVELDFHGLWAERTSSEISMTYSLGFGSLKTTAQPGVHAAVIAGSPDLEAARREAEAVARRLGQLGWIVESSWDPAADQQPNLLHYAGHGFDDGSLGWQSAIELPGIGRLSAAQIVAGQRAPDKVVLGACSTGRVTAEAIDGGMNLAAAFLLAGASVVIAPLHEVDDTTAYELGASLYRDFGVDEPDALPRALARSQREQFEQGSAPSEAKSYNSWRAWTP
ncbi:MAG: tetratricopeptide repeat protein [Enhygromyxa sp.]